MPRQCKLKESIFDDTMNTCSSAFAAIAIPRLTSSGLESAK